MTRPITRPATRPWSLRGRLLRRVGLGASLSWLVGAGLAALVIAHEMSELMDDTLEQSARLILSLYRDGIGAAPGQGQVRVIVDGDEVIAAPWPALSKDGGHDVAGWRVVRMTDRQTGNVVETGQSDEWRHDELLESLGGLVALLIPVLLATLLAARGAVSSALRPAMRFAQMLRGRSARDLSPVSAPDLPSELAPIPQALNGYLDDIRARMEAERQFATNAAHELRTPIAAASGQAQLIAAGLADAEAAGRLAASLGRMGQLVERMLQLARAEAGVVGHGPCDVVRVVRMVMADNGPRVRFDDGEMTSAAAAVDADALAIILSNLLRNAAEHGTGDLRLTLSAGPVLRLSNAAAPGAAFRHGTFDKSASSQGTGLGLAIVARIAQTQGIDMDFAVTQGRATVTLRLPAEMPDPIR